MCGWKVGGWCNNQPECETLCIKKELRKLNREYISTKFSVVGGEEALQRITL